MSRNENYFRDSEIEFRALFEYATLGILIVSNHGVIELANPFAEKLFGYKNNELIGQPIEILVPNGFRGNHHEHHKEYFKNPESRPMGLGMQLFALRKDGTQFPAEISLGHYNNNGLDVAFTYISDISVRVANEEIYRDLYENSLVAFFTMDMKTLKIINVNILLLKLYLITTYINYLIGT